MKQNPDETRLTLDGFLQQHRVTMSAKWTDSNPNMPDETGRQPMDHWRCTLRHDRRTMTLVFSKGIGHHGAEPTVGEVLDCLASDAAGIENTRTRGFEDWCDEYGYDTDSRTAERTYKACERQAAGLKRLLGEDAYEALLWRTERE